MKRPLRRLILSSTMAVVGATVSWLGPETRDLAAAEPPAKPPAQARYRDAKAPVNDRVTDVLARMMPAEKVAQLLSVNWEHTHLDDAQTHALSPAAGKKLIGNAGDEVVQLYLHDLVSSVTRPISELKGFRRAHLRAGESSKVDFAIGFNELSFHERGDEAGGRARPLRGDDRGQLGQSREARSRGRSAPIARAT